jgi:uncharacterized DUF497 family protein
LSRLDEIFETAEYEPEHRWVVIGLFADRAFVIALCTTEDRANEVASAALEEGEVESIRVVYSDATII